MPSGRLGQPEDIAYLYQYLASEQAAHISGQLIAADGARYLSGLD
jgi:3-oxoacyl-[acyl-carrier protein] reductase